jgi:capsid protein
MPRGWSYIDPLKDVQADEKAIRCGLKTQAQVVAEQGGDLEELMTARKAEIDRADELELQFDSNPADDDTSGYVEPTIPAMDATEDAAKEESDAVDTLTTDEATTNGPYA